MIEYDHDTENQRCVCKSDKMLTEVYIEKEEGPFRFFIFRFEKGQVPHKLAGRYSSIPAAQRDLEHYLRTKPVTKNKRVKERADRREKERNAAKLESKGS